MDNVRFFWLLPITHQERLFLDTHSVEELETKFDEAGIDYLDSIDSNFPVIITTDGCCLSS